jgi:hypothetical protein
VPAAACLAKRKCSEISEALRIFGGIDQAASVLSPPQFITPLIYRTFFDMRNLSLLAHFLRRGVGWLAGTQIRQVEGNIDVQA